MAVLPLIGTAISAGSSIASSLIGGSAAKKAAEKQLEAAIEVAHQQHKTALAVAEEEARGIRELARSKESVARGELMLSLVGSQVRSSAEAAQTAASAFEVSQKRTTGLVTTTALVAGAALGGTLLFVYLIRRPPRRRPKKRRRR